MGTSIKVGDTVQVMSGKRNRNPEKPPTRGRVLRVDREASLVWIEGVNMRVRHLKKSPRHPQGGRLERESPIAASNVMLVTGDGVPVRLAKAVRAEDGKITARTAGK
jgi:large subunit ribosomal protein L24